VTAVDGDVVRVDVEVLMGRHVGVGCCLIDGELVLADLPGLPEPQALPVAALPEWLAGLVGLGPRPAASAPGSLVTRARVLDAVLALDGASARSVLAATGPVPGPWPELLAAVSGGLAGRWRVAVTGLASGDEHLEVLDCADAGLWAVQPCPPATLPDDDLPPSPTPDDPPVLLTPTTPTTLWAWLSRLARPLPPASG
jgi:hypothetical protein